MMKRHAYTLLLVSLVAVFGSPRCLQGAETTGWEWTQSAGWARLEGSARGTPEEQLAFARSLEEKQAYYDAARQYFLLVRTFPDSEEAKQGLALLAECLFKNENYYQSFQAIETFLERYPKSAHLDELLDLEYRIGRQFLAGARVSLFDKEQPRRRSLTAALAVFQAIRKHDEYGRLADRAHYFSGEALLELDAPRQARDQFSLLISRFPESPLVPMARYKIKLANIPLGVGTVSEAMEELERLRSAPNAQSETPAAADPGEALVAQALAKSQTDLASQEAARMLQAGAFYERRHTPKSYDAALFTYRELLRRYPDVPEAAKAQERLAALENEGPPAPGIGEGHLNLPKIRKPNLLFWRRRETAETEPPAEKTPADAGGLAPHSTTAAAPRDYPALDATPLNPQIYKADGVVILDLDAEETRLRHLQSGATAPAAAGEPASEAVAAAPAPEPEPTPGPEPEAEAPPPAAEAPAMAKAEPVVAEGPASTDEAPAPSPPAPEAAPAPVADEGGAIVIDLSAEGEAGPLAGTEATADEPTPAAPAAPEPEPAAPEPRRTRQPGWVWGKEFDQ